MEERPEGMSIVAVLAEHLLPGDIDEPYMRYLRSSSPSDILAASEAMFKARLNGWQSQESEGSSNGMLFTHPDKEGFWTLREVCEDALGISES